MRRARWTSQQVVERGQRAAACPEKEKKRERVGARGRQTAPRKRDATYRIEREGNARRRTSWLSGGRGRDEGGGRARAPRSEEERGIARDGDEDGERESGRKREGRERRVPTFGSEFLLRALRA